MFVALSLTPCLVLLTQDNVSAKSSEEASNEGEEAEAERVSGNLRQYG